jgi:hypothetical protein
MPTRTYIVTLERVLMGRQLAPAATVFTPDQVAEVGGFHGLIKPGTLAIWRVEGTVKTRVVDLIIAHLLGDAPYYVDELWRRPPEPDPTAKFDDGFFADKQFDRDELRDAIVRLRKEMGDDPALRVAVMDES